MTLIIMSGLTYGLIYSIVLSVIVIGSMLWNLEIWYEDYPLEIKEQYGPMSETAKRNRQAFTPIFAFVMFGLPVILFWILDGKTSFHFTLIDRFFLFYIILGLFHLIDLIVIDWLIGMVWDPNWLRLPGTDQGPHYWTFRKHIGDFGKAMAAMIPAALLLVGISQLLIG
jgi:hypothetical protein